ncbi:MAG: M4 family metallopeptidase [Sphingobacteriales bacterium]|nr:MAG: M4 family metallopeptidase [Sphingobacteriales bacterium]
MPVIPVSVCNFGSCTEYRLSTDNLQVFCQSGFFNGWVANPRQSFIDWTLNGPDIENKHYSPAINISNITLPSTIDNGDGAATFGIVAGSGSTTFTYSGTQILTTIGLVSSSIPITISGQIANNLTAGIYELTLTDDNGCVYTEYAALGMQGGPDVTGNVTEAADCYNNTGNIHLSVANVASFGGQLPQIWIKGPFNTAGFVVPPIFGITDNNYEFDLKQFNDPISGTEDHYPLPPGNYAILVLNPYNNTVGGFNIRINYPAGGCETERRILETAHWAIDRTQNIFKGDNSAINGGTGINLQFPSSIQIQYGATVYTDGYCQLTNSPHPICVGLVNDANYNAKFIPNTIVGPEMANNGKTLFKVTRGISATYPTVSLDVMAHEYGHALNRYGVSVSASTTDSEAEAINEGFSDIIACIVESTCKPSTDPNIWIIGDAFPTSFPKRNIANPNTNHFPAIYEGQYWNPTPDDEAIYGLQYIRSSVFAYWFYLLATGGSQTVNGISYTVEAIGMENAAKIILAAFVDESFDLSIPANQNYHGLCAATIKAADALFPADSEGNCSSQLKQVYAAWKAVGVNCPMPTGIICTLCSEVEPENAICDNHLPYIQSVQINDIATGYIIAHQSWELTESQTHLCLVNNIEPEQTTDLTQGLFLTVVTSEPMSNLAFAGAVAPTGIIYYSGINQVSGSGTNWFFTLSSFNLAGFDSNTDYKLRFSGQDLAGNGLISMHEYEGANSTPPCIATNALPYKDTNENWVNYISGYDKSFGFTYRCNLSVELLIVCNYTSTTSSVYFDINITSCAEDEVTWLAQMDWDGDGNFDQESFVNNSVNMGTSILYNSTSNGQAQLTFTNTITGEQLVLNAYCNDIPVSDECENAPPDFDDSTFSQNPHYCLGESVCITYYVTDLNPIENVACSVADATHTYQSGYHHNPDAPNYDDAYYWQSGTFCFTPTASDAAQGDIVVFLSATDLVASSCQLIGHAACIVTNLCCPTGFDYPQELEAVYDCNGDLYQPAEATVTALTNGCNLDFTLNGSSNHTLSHLGEGVYDLTLSFNNQTYLIEDAITVSGIYMDDGNLQITHTTQPSLAACSSDQCNGQITLSVAGGSGNYTYHWSDCIPPPGEMMLPCNSPLRNYLCTGSYTVTVADDLTGCETVYTANVNLYYPPNAGVLSDNEFSVSPTVFSGSTTLTYRVGYDAQVSISMFSSQGILVDAPLQQEFRAKGQYNMTHSPPSGLPQGVYYYVLYVCEQYITRVAIKIG